mgnify:CR=1 FL=1
MTYNIVQIQYMALEVALAGCYFSWNEARILQWTDGPELTYAPCILEAACFGPVHAQGTSEHAHEYHLPRLRV